MAEEYVHHRAEQQTATLWPFASPRKHGARVFMRGVPTSAIFIDSSAPYSVEVAPFNIGSGGPGTATNCNDNKQTRVSQKMSSSADQWLTLLIFGPEKINLGP